MVNKIDYIDHRKPEPHDLIIIQDLKMTHVT